METLVEMIDQAPDPRAVLDRLAGEIEKLAAILAPDAPLEEIMSMLTSLIVDFQGDGSEASLQ
ncbi:MAG: hypothetical protein NTW56_04925 [Alphaproteobacteria bacterium]|nr:hypothetical protein [Alphaproteobacteria bacterium]